MDEILKFVFVILIMGGFWLFEKIGKSDAVDDRDEITEEDLKEFRRQDEARRQAALERQKNLKNLQRKTLAHPQSSTPTSHFPQRAKLAEKPKASAPLRGHSSRSHSLESAANFAPQNKDSENTTAKVEDMLKALNELKNNTAYNLKTNEALDASTAYDIKREAKKKTYALPENLNLNSAADLRRAFLVSEILARPLALRDGFSENPLGPRK